jgi:hypothetical protein
MAKLAIRVHMEPDLVEQIDEQAAREDRSRNWTINDLVKRGLAEVQTQERILTEQGSLNVVRGGVAEGVPTDEGWVAPQGSTDELIQQDAIRPTLDARRAERPHRHRFTVEVANTRRGKAGRQVADYACDCGEIKPELPVK